MYRIGLFSKLGKVTVKTLHHYDEVGLLRPAQVDAETGYRYYTSDQLFRLHEIVALRQMGFSVAEVAAMVDGHNVAELLARRETELRDEIQEATARLFRLTHYMTEQKEGICMAYRAIVKEIPACTVFSARRVIPNHAALLEVMPALGEQVAKANPGLACTQPDYCFNIYRDEAYKETDIDVEICQAVTRRGKDGDGVVFKDLPAVTVVSVLHRGPYEGIGAAYAYALSWVEQNGYRIAGPVRESYIDGVWNKDSEADWLTEIQVPVEKQ